SSTSSRSSTLPSTAGASWRRIVSTSGSSGIALDTSLPLVITIEREPFDSPAAQALRDEQRDELIARYGFDSEPGIKPTAADIPVFLVARSHGDPVGCGALRPIEPGLVEIKRMYVRPAERGNGFGKLILGALEAEARALGAERVVLETGVAQPESIGL